MIKKNDDLTKGDWIVHTYYGVGQIKGVEKRKIGGEKTKYFKVVSNNSTFFIPTENIEPNRIRPVASKYKLRKAIKELKDQPGPLESDHNLRKKQIAEKLSDSSLDNTARLIRDLYARRISSGLNDHEETTLKKITDRLVLEWSISDDIEKDLAQNKFEIALQEGAAHIIETE